MRQAVFSFNKGLVSRLGLGRVDLKRLSLAATTMTNWLCRVLGYMFVRPGMGYIGGTLSNAEAVNIPFVFSTDDTALIELSTAGMRVRIGDTILSYPAVSTAVTDPSFATGAGWTDLDEAGGVSSVGGGTMQLVGNGTAYAIREQQVTVALADRSIEHCLHIRVNRGPVRCTIGSASGGTDYLTEQLLACGEHYISFTPTGASFYVRFYSELQRSILLQFCTIVTGEMQITTPWTTIAGLRSISYDQSGDVVYMASQDAGASVRQLQIERRGTGRSWSLVVYAPEDGPFNVENVTPTTITPSGLNGNITLTASRAIFTSGHEAPSRGVGALFSLTSTGQTVTTSVTAQNTFTNAIRISGVGTSRAFTIVRSGTFVATITLQRSIDSSTGPWSDVSGETYTTAGTKSFNDALDNQIAWYRIGVKTGDYTSGTATLTLTISSGNIRGICRITTINSSISANAEVITDLGATTATDVWQEGSWSTAQGYPTCVRLHDGRLWWAGGGKVWGSISDGYALFDETFEGDAGPISRSIASGPVDNINWMLSMQRLLVGTEGAEFSIKASSLDEPLTPTNFGIRPTSTQGSKSVRSISADQMGYFVNRSGMKLYELMPSGQLSDYTALDLTAIVPEVGYPSIVRIDIQRQPDTRIHCVLSDGTCAVLVLDHTEEVTAWVKFETDGSIEDVAVLPADNGDLDDRVYYTVKRNINGSYARYVERLAQEIDCRGGAASFLADSYVYYSGSAISTITGLGSLEGESVVVWADGADVGTADDGSLTYTVSGGQITLAVAASKVVVGLPYTAQYKSAKLGSSGEPASLFSQKKGGHIGLLLADYHTRGLRFGADFTVMDDLPLISEGALTAAEVRSELHEQPIEFPGFWGSNSRLCLEAKAPRPCSVLAMVAYMSVA